MTTTLQDLVDGPIWGDATVQRELRQIVSRAVVSQSVIDIFAAAGLEEPNISVLSDELLEEVRGLAQKNMAVALLGKFIRGEATERQKTNVIQAKSFAEILDLLRAATRTAPSRPPR